MHGHHRYIKNTSLIRTLFCAAHINTVRKLIWCSLELASFPGSTQLSVASSTLFQTASDGKLGGAWEWGYSGIALYYHTMIHEATIVVTMLSQVEWQPPTYSLRINFTVKDLAPASPEYEYFRSCMEKDYPFEDGKLQFSAQQLSTDFPQYFHYERVKELVSHSCVLYWTSVEEYNSLYETNNLLAPLCK